MGVNRYGEHKAYRAKKIVLGAGAIGNSRLLLNSGFKKKLPALGRNFYTHPQSMLIGLYERPINAHKGPLQSLKSNDATFRANYFKLENVFAPPWRHCYVGARSGASTFVGDEALCSRHVLKWPFVIPIPGNFCGRQWRAW